jgi:tetratricopeptide (TPR) repeat protein
VTSFPDISINAPWRQLKLFIALTTTKNRLWLIPLAIFCHYCSASYAQPSAPTTVSRHVQHAKPANLDGQLDLLRADLKAGRTVQALKVANEVSAQHADDVQVHFTLGMLLASYKQYRVGARELELAQALQPERFEIFFNLGQTYLHLQEYGKAELVLNRALRHRPDSPEILDLLATVYSNQKRPLDALDLLLRAYKLAPQNTDIILHLARVSMSERYYQDAIPILEAGIEIAPQNADLRADLGESYFLSGKVERAIAEFRTLIQLDPSARTYALMGLSFRHLGRFDEARKYFQTGLERDPRNASCLFNLGYIEERQGDHVAAEKLFEATLRSRANFPDALAELANLRIAGKQFEQAAELLRRYIRRADDPSAGYYKLAMVERNLHQYQAAQRDLNVFHTLAKNSSIEPPIRVEHLFDFINNRSTLSAPDRTQLDLNQLIEQVQKHPDRPQDLYLLAEVHLKLGQSQEALNVIAKLDQLSGDDYRTQAGVGVLLARHHLYDDSIKHFQAALRANPDSDDVKFDLADAYFRKGFYPQAMETAQQLSAAGQQDDAFLALLADIRAHLGDIAGAREIFREAISRSPDNDQYYLSLGLIQLRENDSDGAESIFRKGLARIPSSGKLLWGLGVVSALQGKTVQAAKCFEQAVDMLPEWSGSYSILGVFYYQTGQIAKAREVLNRFKGSNAGGLDVNRIEAALSSAPANSASLNEPMSMAAKQQLLQFALALADRTL